MSDARWSEIDADIAAAVNHFTHAVRIYRQAGLHADTDDGYLRRMGFMHAMLAGYTSVESALLRILEMQGEEQPTGRQWHADLVQRAGHATAGRPAILPGSLMHAIDRTRRFRHVAAHAYDTFDPDDADPAVGAAEKVAAGLSAAIAAYRAAIDP